jgi:hypothetical protein
VGNEDDGAHQATLSEALGAATATPAFDLSAPATRREAKPAPKANRSKGPKLFAAAAPTK